MKKIWMSIGVIGIVLGAVGLATGLFLMASITDPLGTYDEGYDAGYLVGYDVGYALGNETGFAQGNESAYDEGYLAGYNVGYQAGLDASPFQWNTLTLDMSNCSFIKPEYETEASVNVTLDHYQEDEYFIENASGSIPLPQNSTDYEIEITEENYGENYTLIVEDSATSGFNTCSDNHNAMSFSITENCYLNNVSVKIIENNGIAGPLDLFLLHSFANGKPNSSIIPSNRIDSKTVSIGYDGWFTFNLSNPYYLDTTLTNDSTWFISVYQYTGSDASINWYYTNDAGEVDEGAAYVSPFPFTLQAVDYQMMMGINYSKPDYLEWSLSNVTDNWFFDYTSSTINFTINATAYVFSEYFGITSIVTTQTENITVTGIYSIVKQNDVEVPMEVYFYANAGNYSFWNVIAESEWDLESIYEFGELKISCIHEMYDDLEYRELAKSFSDYNLTDEYVFHYEIFKEQSILFTNFEFSINDTTFNMVIIGALMIELSQDSVFMIHELTFSSIGDSPEWTALFSIDDDYYFVDTTA